MKDPVDHILRPRLPWREDIGITECGLDGTKVPTLTRDQFFQRLKDLGQQRTAMTTCMTCSTTAARWGTWDDDPRWETAWRRDDHGARLRDELQAAAMLIEAHREEFDEYVAAAEQRRAWNEKKAANREAKTARSGVR